MNVLAPIPHIVEYSRDGGFSWTRLSDTYDSFAAAATIATALDNRGFKTRIVEAA